METRGGVPTLVEPRSAGSGRLCWLVTLASACAAFGVSAAQAGLGDLRVRLSADYTFDDNVTRAPSGNELSDRFAGLNLGANLPVELTSHSRLLLTATLGGEKFNRYSGLDRAFVNFQGELQYRSSGDFAAPTYGIFVRQGVDWFDSDLRDGYRTSVGLSIRKPMTDRIFLYGAVAYNRRDADSTVFDTNEFSLRGNLDYLFSRRHTLYLGLEYREGDSVSTSRPNPALVAIREVAVRDDVFTDTIRNSYRFNARTGILTLGYNFAVKERQALDISYRVVYSRPKEQPGGALATETIYYVDNQIVLSYLIRF